MNRSIPPPPPETSKLPRFDRAGARWGAGCWPGAHSSGLSPCWLRGFPMQKWALVLCSFFVFLFGDRTQVLWCCGFEENRKPDLHFSGSGPNPYFDEPYPEWSTPRKTWLSFLTKVTESVGMSVGLIDRVNLLCCW